MTCIETDIAITLRYFKEIWYWQVAGGVALFYDYLLLIDREVGLIWKQKWTLVTLLYAVVRYLSFPLVVNTAISMGNINWTGQECLVLYEIRVWAPCVYKIAMDVIMMKRIRALSNASSRFVGASKWIWILMVLCCVAKYAATIILLMLGVGPGSHITAAEYEFNGTFMCGTFLQNTGYLISADIPAMCFEILLFVLALFYFALDVSESYRPLNLPTPSAYPRSSDTQPEDQKETEVNKLMHIIGRDSIIYFALNLAATLLNVGDWQTSTATSYAPMAMSMEAFVPFCFVPRLVINVRECDRKAHMRGYSDADNRPTRGLRRPDQQIDSLA